MWDETSGTSRIPCTRSYGVTDGLRRPRDGRWWTDDGQARPPLDMAPPTRRAPVAVLHVVVWYLAPAQCQHVGPVVCRPLRRGQPARDRDHHRHRGEPLELLGTRGTAARA